MGGGQESPLVSYENDAVTGNDNNAGGDGGVYPDFEGHLVLAWMFDKPASVIERIQKRYPKLRISFVDIHNGGVSDEQYATATVLSTMSSLPKDAAILKAIKFIHLTSAGINQILNHPIYTDTKIPITTSSGIHGPTIAEWVVLTLLSHPHRFPLLLDWQKSGRWHTPAEAGAALWGVRDYVGQTIAILGYGSIGRQIARAAKGLGMKVLAYTATPRNTKESRRDDGYIVPGTGDPEGVLPEKWFSGLDEESLHDFLRQKIDVFVISVPLTEKTKGIIGEEELSLLGRADGEKPFLINIARGQLLSSPGLIKGLKSFEESKGAHGLRGAALDVTDPEPLPEGDNLWKAPNLFISPHVSAYSQNYAERCAQVLEGNLEHLRKGEKLWNEVDRRRGY